MMIVRPLLTRFLLALVTILPATPAIAAAPVSEIVMDAGTGRVLYAAQADRQRPPASLTKMMTLYLLFQDLSAGKLTMNSPITVSLVGRTTTASSSSLPPACVTTASSGLKPSTSQSSG